MELACKMKYALAESGRRDEGSEDSDTDDD